MLRQKQGSFINFSTIAVPLGLKGESVYVASKAGVEGFTKTFAKEVANFNIKVNCIAPGPIKTDLIKGVTDKQIQKIKRTNMIKGVCAGFSRRRHVFSEIILQHLCITICD